MYINQKLSKQIKIMNLSYYSIFLNFRLNNQIKLNHLILKYLILLQITQYPIRITIFIGILNLMIL